MLLIFDNYDSFTYNLADYFKQLGQQLLVIRNDEKSLDDIEKIKFTGIVFSPGPGIPANSGILMPLIERWHTRIPILGICLGHQAIGSFFGLNLIKAPYPMHGKVSTIETTNHMMWNNLPKSFDVCRYHSLVLSSVFNLVSTNQNVGNINQDEENDSLSDSGFASQNENQLIPTARSLDDGSIMAIAHKNLPIWGIQFHPEAILTQNGLQILNNWLKAFILHT